MKKSKKTQTLATANKPKRIFKHNLQHKKKNRTQKTLATLNLDIKRICKT